MYSASKDRYDKMVYKRVGQSGLKLPALSLGLWHNFGSVDSFENQKAIIHQAFDLGITYFDLANNYGPEPGSAEENFGRIMAGDMKAYRDEMIIASKAGYYMWPGPYGEWGSRKNIIASANQSLKRMDLDYVDIFILTGLIRKHRWKKRLWHWMNWFTKERPFTWEFLIIMVNRQPKSLKFSMI